MIDSTPSSATKSMQSSHWVFSPQFHASSRVPYCRQHSLASQAGMSVEDLLDRLPGSQPLQNRLHGDASTGNDRLSQHYCWIGLDKLVTHASPHSGFYPDSRTHSDDS